MRVCAGGQYTLDARWIDTYTKEYIKTTLDLGRFLSSKLEIVIPIRASSYGGDLISQWLIKYVLTPLN